MIHTQYVWAQAPEAAQRGHASDDQKEGMAAFIEKRKPNWTGR
jgi:1,4-dihydroxy-2-naphthoyl-CoA synthase